MSYWIYCSRTALLLAVLAAPCTVYAAAAVAPCPATDCINYPADAGMLNVKDFGAYGDGVHDDTAAINAALNASSGDTGATFWQNRRVYLPIGTYLVSGPLMKRAADGSFTSGFVLIGQSRQATMIKLANQAPGYQDAANPQAVIFTTSKLLDPRFLTGGGRDYTGKGEGNDAYANFVENLTVDVGDNNPGAIGIDYLANNHGAIRRVTVQAPASSGAIGISMQRKWPGPALLQDVQVNGFGTGIAVDQTEYSVTMERITLQAQRSYGLYNNHNMLSVRVLRTRDVPTPVVNAAEDGMIELLGADLSTTLPGFTDPIVNKGSMNIRSLGMRGYGLLMGIVPALASFISGAYTLDGAYSGTKKLSNSYQNWSLPMTDPPAPPNTAVNKWVSIAQYGAVADGYSSATAAIRQAFASGADTIYLPFGSYLVDDNIVVPPSVRRIVGMGSTLKVSSNRLVAFDRTLGVLRATNNVNPLIVEDLAIDNSGLGDQVLFEASGTQPLVLRDVIAAGGTALWRPAAGGKAFVENVSGGQIVLEGKEGVWLRQINTEGQGVRITNKGAPLWVFGVKTEGVCTVVDNSAGGKTEVLGGLVYITATNPDANVPAFRNTDGTMLLSYVEESTTSNSSYAIHLQSTINGVTKNVLASSLTARGLGRVVPLLVSTALPKTAVTVTLPVDGGLANSGTTQPTQPTQPTTPVVVPVPQGPLFGDAFGVNIKRERITKSELDLIASIGIKRVRTSITWYAVEQQKGVYRWNANLPRESVADDYATNPWYSFDSFFASLKERKLHPDVQLMEGNFQYNGMVNIAPAGSPPDMRLAAPHSPTEIAAFAAFAGATVQHYKGIYGPSAFSWHIWNEPDTDGGFAPKTDPGIVGKLVADSCAAIKQADPTAKVFGPALGAYGEGDIRYDFIDGMFSQANPLNCIDVFTVHPYRSAVPETAVVDYARVLQHLAKWQPAGKPAVKVGVDEWAYSIAIPTWIPWTQLWRNFSGEEQAALMLRMYLINLINDVPLTVIYDWRDRGTDPYEWEDHFGIMGFNREEKPALKMFKTVWPLMSGRALQLVSFVPQSCTTHEHSLRFGSTAADSSGWTVLWTDDTASKQVLIQGQVQQVMDIFGNNKSLSNVTGGQGLVLTGYPLLVKHSLTSPPNFSCTTSLASAQ